MKVKTGDAAPAPAARGKTHRHPERANILKENHAPKNMKIPQETRESPKKHRLPSKHTLSPFKEGRPPGFSLRFYATIGTARRSLEDPQKPTQNRGNALLRDPEGAFPVQKKKQTAPERRKKTTRKNSTRKQHGRTADKNGRDVTP